MSLNGRIRVPKLLWNFHFCSNIAIRPPKDAFGLFPIVVGFPFAAPLVSVDVDPPLVIDAAPLFEDCGIADPLAAPLVAAIGGVPLFELCGSGDPLGAPRVVVVDGEPLFEICGRGEPRLGTGCCVKGVGPLLG